MVDVRVSSLTSVAAADILGADIVYLEHSSSFSSAAVTITNLTSAVKRLGDIAGSNSVSAMIAAYAQAAGDYVTSTSISTMITTEITTQQLISSNSISVFVAAYAEPIDADILRADTADQLTAAFTAAVDDDGTQSSGTYTPSVAAGSNYKKIVNGGAFAFAPPSPASNEAVTLSVLVVNTTGAGAITTTGFTIVTGDAFTTTTTDEFMCRVEVYDIAATEYSSLDVVALQ